MHNIFYKGNLYAEMLSHTEALHREASTQRSPHTHTEAFTHRSFYTQKLSHREAFTQRSFYTQKQRIFSRPTRLHTLVCTRRSFSHRSFYSQKLLYGEPLKQRRFYTEGLLHLNSFSHKEVIKHGRFTIRSVYAQQLLHRAEIAHRSLDTEELLQPDASTHRSFATKLLHTKLLRRGPLTHTQKPLCTEALQRELVKQRNRKALSREAFTHRSFYTHRSVLNTEAFTYRNFYAESHKPIGRPPTPSQALTFTSPLDLPKTAEH